VTSAVSYKKVREEVRNIQADIPVQDISYIKIYATYNVRGKLRSFRYKPSRINVMFQTEPGKWFSFKTSPEMLKSGIMVEKLILTNQDFADFFGKKDSLPTISRVKLQSDSRYFSPDIKVEYFKIAP